jgi:hypothetical protein
MLMISERKILAPDVFHFAVPGQPCAYWDACRCGKAFLLVEKEAK